ncbi:MAG: putative transrane anti-sigma factor [Leifsonia sp.]|jgi:RNA polymerase sigma-70 factor (ECF subfamily)|nr:putative transrane anti-sigma factor [Leifsonia sp.]MDQ1588482.1 hypothetical protein [Microbacteriaceae bacterium]
MSADVYSDWDAAYVMGSLSPMERREFERHLATCASCSAAVAELAALPGLLAKLPAAEARGHLLPESEAPVPATLLPRLVRSVARRRRRIRTFVASGVVVAAAAAAAIVLMIPQVFPGAAPHNAATGTEVTLSQVIPSSMNASIRLVNEGWGTRIEMNCRYDKVGGSNPTDYTRDAAHTYAMYVTDTAGQTTQIATWTAKPGSVAEPSGTTSLAPDKIATVDVRSAANGQVLLRGSP